MWAAGSMAAAAVLLIVLLNPLAKPEFTLGIGEFVTGASETATVVLADGTVVRLGPESRLRIPGIRGSREVFLDGTAFFAVAKLPEYPFRVRTRAGDAQVLGTRFEIRTNAGNLRVVVLEGRVALESGTDRVEVGAGEMSLISEGTSSAPVKVDDIRPLVPWLERFLVFQSTPLAEVAMELEREYGVPVEIADDALAGLTVTGWYADKSFEEVLAVVCGVLRAECSIRGGVAYVESGGGRFGPASNRPHGELHNPDPEEP